MDVYVTGSNSRMMSSEISTYLTGRYIAFRIFILSFSEYLMFKEKYDAVTNPRSELAEYVRLGGFPATHLQKYSQDESYTIVQDIYSSTIFSGIVKRSQVRKIDQLERVVKYTFHNVGSTFSAKSIPDYLKSERRTLDNETVHGYLVKLEKAYRLHRCSRYDLQGKEILKTQEIRSEKTKQREYNRLLEIHDNYPKYVLRADDFSGGNYKCIKTMPIADFLLSAEF